MGMAIGHPEMARRIVFEVELDQHRRLVSHHPAVMPGFNRDHLGSYKLHDAAIGKFHVNLPLGKKSHVSVHAEIGADRRFHVSRPAEPGWVNHALNARRADANDVELYASDFGVLGSFHGREKSIGRTHVSLLHRISEFHHLPGRIPIERMRFRVLEDTAHLQAELSVFLDLAERRS